MMKRLLFLVPAFAFSVLFSSCEGSSGSMNDISWIVGHWQGKDLDDLVFHESWERDGKDSYTGFGCTLTPDGDTVFKETLKINLVEGKPYYVATVPKNKGPVLFKMIKGDAKNAIFENREHDFPQRISYMLETNNTVKVKLEGIEKGVPKIETLEFERVKTEKLNTQPGMNTPDSTKADTNIKIQIIQGG